MLRVGIRGERGTDTLTGWGSHGQGGLARCTCSTHWSVGAGKSRWGTRATCDRVGCSCSTHRRRHRHPLHRAARVPAAASGTRETYVLAGCSCSTRHRRRHRRQCGCRCAPEGTRATCGRAGCSYSTHRRRHHRQRRRGARVPAAASGSRETCVRAGCNCSTRRTIGEGHHRHPEGIRERSDLSGCKRGKPSRTLKDYLHLITNPPRSLSPSSKTVGMQLDPALHRFPNHEPSPE